MEFHKLGFGGGKFKDEGLSLNLRGMNSNSLIFGLASGLGGLSGRPHSESAEYAALGLDGGGWKRRRELCEGGWGMGWSEWGLRGVCLRACRGVDGGGWKTGLAFERVCAWLCWLMLCIDWYEIKLACFVGRAWRRWAVRLVRWEGVEG